jgi:hypothetical protein
MGNCPSMGWKEMHRTAREECQQVTRMATERSSQVMPIGSSGFDLSAANVGLLPLRAGHLDLKQNNLT